MKLILLLTTAGTLLFSGTTYASDKYVRGYMKRDGTYVEPHLRSEPDGYKENNRSEMGW
jgi:hypothetical protein